MNWKMRNPMFLHILMKFLTRSAVSLWQERKEQKEEELDLDGFFGVEVVEVVEWFLVFILTLRSSIGTSSIAAGL